MASGNKPFNGEDAESVLDRAKSGAGQVFEQAQEKLGQVANEAQQQAKSQLAEGKDRVADSIDNVAQALRRTSDELAGQDASGVGNYANKVADALVDASHHLRDNDIDQLVREMEDVARREPAIFLGGAFALGVIAARFLKSSSQRRYNSERHRNGYSDYDTRGYSRGRSSYSQTGTPYSSYSSGSPGAGVSSSSSYAGYESETSDMRNEWREGR